MPLFVLSVKCDLENMKYIKLNSDAMLQFDIVSQSGEIRNGITVSMLDEIELSGSKGN